MFLPEPLIRLPSQPWRLRQTAEHSPSGMSHPVVAPLPSVLTSPRYENGSLLIATLQPRFTILHNLATSRSPSPVITLAWHASSSRQKSDMLAVQNYDGNLRVWSIPKSHSDENPVKVVRILRKHQSIGKGPNWMGWSKNGRIIQFSNSYVTPILLVFQSWGVEMAVAH